MLCTVIPWRQVRWVLERLRCYDEGGRARTGLSNPWPGFAYAKCQRTKKPLTVAHIDSAHVVRAAAHLRPNICSNMRSDRRLPSSLSATDLALPTGSEIIPLPVQAVERIPGLALPGRPAALVQTQRQQGQHGVVHAIGIHVHVSLR